MEIEYKTKQELVSETKELFEQATLSQYRWMYCYLKDLDEWPIVTDQAAADGIRPIVDELEPEECPNID